MPSLILAHVPYAHTRSLLADAAAMRQVSEDLRSQVQGLRQRSRFLELRVSQQHERSNDLLTTSLFQRHHAANGQFGVPASPLRLIG